jgi:hypothetical protein
LCDLIALGDQREMARFDLNGLGAHALGREPFEVGIIVRSSVETA